MAGENRRKHRGSASVVSPGFAGFRRHGRCKSVAADAESVANPLQRLDPARGA
jgi:hypothetical protein